MERIREIYERFSIFEHCPSLSLPLSLPSCVKIHEVGPRDGLQNEPHILTVTQRIELVDRLLQCGLENVEVGSFVSPKWVPQMANTGDVVRGLQSHDTHRTHLSVLTPNNHGFHDALAVNIREIAVFGACSEEFSKKNINCSIADSLIRYRAICEQAISHGIRVRGYISCVLGCPYQGEVSLECILHIVRQFFDMGCYEVSLGDTIGAGTPLSTHTLLTHLTQNGIPIDRLSVHFHDTHSRALSNILVALAHGVTSVDSSVTGLGGCPYAKFCLEDGNDDDAIEQTIKRQRNLPDDFPVLQHRKRSAGNVATEDVVWLLHRLGVQCSVRMRELLEVGVYLKEILGHESRGVVPYRYLEEIVQEQDEEEKISQQN